LTDNIIQHELADYNTMIGKAEGLCANSKCQPNTIAQWRANNDILDKFPCLSCVAVHCMECSQGQVDCNATLVGSEI
jgi:hypothetical protein